MHGRLGGYPVAQHLNFKEGLSWVGMVVEAPEPDSLRVSAESRFDFEYRASVWSSVFGVRLPFWFGA